MVEDEMSQEDLMAELSRLGRIESHRDLLLGEIDELKAKLSQARQQYAELKEQLDEMSVDMSFMEERIKQASQPELSGWDS